MDGSDEAAAEAAGIEAAERLIQSWDSTSSADARERMLFHGPDRSESERYLRAVDEIRRLSIRETASADGSPRRSSSSSLSASESIQLAMARLEDEFRNILTSRANVLEADSLLDDVALLSMSSVGDPDAEEEGEGEEEGEEEKEEEESVVARASTLSWRRSTSSIREIDLIPADAVQDLRSIAERMIAAGYERECFQAYSGVRKAAVDHCLRQLGVEKLSIGDVQRLQWEILERKIRQWIRPARACVRIVFASERRLCDLIFDGHGGADDAGRSASGSGPDVPFLETVKGAALQLFGFAEAISIGRRSPEKLFKILDLYDTLSDLLPDVEAVFLWSGSSNSSSSSSSSSASSSIHTQVIEIRSRLAEAARGTLSAFENAVHQEISKPVRFGTVHPITRYVMNYLVLICAYKETLSNLVLSRPTIINHASDNPDEPMPLPEVHAPILENQSPLAAHLVWIIAILDANIDSTVKLYKDNALGFLFQMNNVHYIVEKAKGMPELRELIGDDYLKKLSGKFQQTATNYERAAWVKVLHCLRDEGIHVSGSFSSGVSKSTLRERFKSFNSAFEEAHRTQSGWCVPDVQLREELRISISEKLLPAYRSFLGRFRHHIENGRHPELYIKYTVDDLEAALADFFEGSTPSQHGRRRQ